MVSATVWYLVLVMWGGGEPSTPGPAPVSVLRFPINGGCDPATTLSCSSIIANICKDTLTAMKFPPAGNVQAGWNYGSANMAAFCMRGGGEILTQEVPVVP